MAKKLSLKERVEQKPLGVWSVHDIVRAELDRLARQVRRLDDDPRTFNRGHIFYKHALDDVLKLIAQAKQ